MATVPVSRGKSFTPEQDEAICKAYLSITEDPIIGNSQPRSQFWNRVLEEYKKRTNDEQRSDSSIRCRWQIIQKCCNKFRGCLKSVESLHQSGLTRQNEYDMAKQSYYEDTGKYFTGLDGCWAILEQSIKWQDVVPNVCKSKTPEEVPEMCKSPDAKMSPLSGGSTSISSPRKRPPGRKLAKDRKAKTKVQEVANERQINLLEKLNKTVAENQARRIELEERRTVSLERQTTCEEKETERKEIEMEERIMGMDLSAIHDPERKAYYQHRRAAILAKWNNLNTTTYFTNLPEY